MYLAELGLQINQIYSNVKIDCWVKDKHTKDSRSSLLNHDLRKIIFSHVCLRVQPATESIELRVYSRKTRIQNLNLPFYGWNHYKNFCEVLAVSDICSLLAFV